MDGAVSTAEASEDVFSPTMVALCGHMPSLHELDSSTANLGWLEGVTSLELVEGRVWSVGKLALTL